MQPARIAVYAALGVILLLLGVDAIRGGGEGAGGAAGSGGPLAEGPLLDPAGSGAAAGKLVVHVAGAVAEPGVYPLPAGSRVTDAIARAGGPAGGAVTDGINLAARLADGQQVVVPDRRSAALAAAGGAPEGPISLGSATAAQLEEIEGIGPVTAGKILEFRDQRGGIGAVEELDEVPGIGPATLEALAARLQP